MKHLHQALTEYLYHHTIEGTKPRLVWYENRYLVTQYFSDATILRLGGEILK